jgi:hypothetical protein
MSHRHCNPTSKTIGRAIPPETAGRAGDNPSVHDVGVGGASRPCSAACEKAQNEDQLFHHHLLLPRKPPGCANINKQYRCVNKYLIVFKCAVDNIFYFM